MPEKKSFTPTIDQVKLHDHNGDLSKRWYISYYTPRGKRVREYGGVNRIKDAAGRLAALQQLARKVSKPKDLRPDLVRKLEGWLEDKRHTFRHGEKRESTYLHYRGKIRQFATWYKDQVPGPVNGREFLRWLSIDRRLSTTTINDYRVIFKSAFRDLLEAGHVEENPFEGIPRIRYIKTPLQYFQPHQVEQLRGVMLQRDPELWLACQFIYYCFSRPAELRILRCGDLFLDEKKLLFRAEVSKNAKQEFVRIPDVFLQDVEHFQDYAPDWYLFGAGGGPGPDPAGFNNLRKRHKKILDLLGYQDCHKLYSWKHTGAHRFIQAGGNLKQLQLQLRHHSLDQVNQYVRTMGLADMDQIATLFPAI